MKSTIVLAMLMMASGMAHASAWPSTNQWSQDWEDKYSKWVDEDFKTDYYVRGPYGQIKTDCADAVYGARVIFAYENELPFITTDGFNGKVLTNETTKFDDTTDSKARFKKFLRYVFEATDTKSLVRDTYSVGINRQQVRAGTVWLQSSKRPGYLELLFNSIDPKKYPAGHAQIVKGVTDAGVVTLMSSTMPGSVREMKEIQEYRSMPRDFSGTGFRAWRWPEYYQVAEDKIPGYSNEQYRLKTNSDDAWAEKATSRLALVIDGKKITETTQQKLDRYANNFCVMARERVGVVLEGEELREKLAGRCMNASQYDDYSTPSRDDSLMISLKRIDAIASQLANAADGSDDDSSSTGSVDPQRAALLKCGQLEYKPGTSIDFVTLAKRVSRKQLIADPNVALEARWGESRGSSTCPQY